MEEDCLGGGKRGLLLESEDRGLIVTEEDCLAKGESDVFEFVLVLVFLSSTEGIRFPREPRRPGSSIHIPWATPRGPQG
jgi:hypothetical protein